MFILNQIPVHIKNASLKVYHEIIGYMANAHKILPLRGHAPQTKTKHILCVISNVGDISDQYLVSILKYQHLLRILKLIV